MQNSPFINTVQNVNINCNIADIGNRIIAYMLDGLFKSIYFGVIYLLIISVFFSNTITIANETDDVLAIFSIIAALILFVPIVFYNLLFPYFMQGQTLGKRIMGIKIVKEDGIEANFGTYFVRWLVGLIDFRILSPLVGLVIMAVTEKRQRLADLVAGTIVISVNKHITVNQAILMQTNPDYQPTFGQVLQLSDNDIRTISQIFELSKKNIDFEAIAKLRHKIEEIIQEYKPELNDTQYVSTIIKDYQFFAEK
jgi:uncharacterized RDD family membrane protein YckC